MLSLYMAYSKLEQIYCNIILTICWNRIRNPGPFTWTIHYSCIQPLPRPYRTKHFLVYCRLYRVKHA